MTDALATIQKEKFKECLKGLPDFVMSGATYEQCLLRILEECGWCFYTQEEDNLVRSIHSYFSKQ